MMWKLCLNRRLSREFYVRAEAHCKRVLLYYMQAYYGENMRSFNFYMNLFNLRLTVVGLEHISSRFKACEPKK